MLREIDTKALEARHMLHFNPISVDGSMCVVFFCLLVVDDQLFGPLGVECKIVVDTPRC